MHLKKIFNTIVFFIFDAIRPMLGPPGCCIYPITCRDYAKITLQKKPIYFAIPMIILRILSCNPITALFLRLKKRIS